MFLRDNQNTPFGGVSDMMLLASSTAAKEISRPVIHWSLNDNYNSLDIAGIRVSIKDLKTGTAKLYVEAKSLLVSEVLLGLPMPHYDLSTLQDDQSNRKDGYGFINDIRNPFFNQRGALAKNIETCHPGRFILGVNSSGTLEMNRHQLKLWLDRVEDLQDKLITLLHITSGMPGRGTELSSMTFINSIHSPRNVYIMWDTIALIADYNKTQALTQRDSSIARFLPKEIASLLLTYLSIVKPFQGYFNAVHCFLNNYSFAASIVHGQAVGDLCGRYIWVRKSRVLSGQDYGISFNSCMIKTFGIDLGIALYRHVSQAFMEKHVKRFSAVLENETQAGHSVETGASIYASSSSESLSTSRSTMQSFYLMSLHWQQLLGWSLSVKVDWLEAGQSGSTIQGTWIKELTSKLDRTFFVSVFLEN